jgi:hypothetical protein
VWRQHLRNSHTYTCTYTQRAREEAERKAREEEAARQQQAAKEKEEETEQVSEEEQAKRAQIMRIMRDQSISAVDRQARIQAICKYIRVYVCMFGGYSVSDKVVASLAVNANLLV